MVSRFLRVTVDARLGWEQLVDVLLKLPLIAAVPPSEYRKLFVVLLTPFFVLAGLGCGRDIDAQAIALVTGGVFAVIRALLFGAPSALPRHEAQAGLVDVPPLTGTSSSSLIEANPRLP